MKILSTAFLFLITNNAFASASLRGLALAEGKERDASSDATVADHQDARELGLFPNDNGNADLVDIIVLLDDDEAGRRLSPENKKSRAADVAQGLGLTAKFTYGNAVYGFSAQKVPRALITRIELSDSVKSVEVDGTATIAIYEDPLEDAALKRKLGQKGSEGRTRNEPLGRKAQKGDKLPGRKLQKGGPGGGGGGGDNTVPQSTPWGISAVGAGGNTTPSGRACVLDTGIDLANADLNVASDCFNAFTSGRDGKSCTDGQGHGTHVAGTIAAIDNDIDVVGVAPGAEVVAIKVLDSRGSGSNSGVIAGVDWAAANDCRTANLSLGGPASSALDQAVVNLAESGTLVVLAAGNDGSNASNTSPARANGANIYTISAMDSNGNLASFSNYGNPPVDVAAPGVGVSSLRVGGGTVTYSGTSMAAPHVAGLLMYNTTVCTSGTVGNDPDGNPDPKAVMCAN